MGKFATYVLIMTGLVLLFYFAGLIPEEANSALLKLLLDPSSFRTSSIGLKAIISLNAIIASAIIIGVAVTGNIELGVMTGFALFLFNTLWDFVQVYSIISSTNPIIAILLLSPILFMFSIATLEWWRGVST